MTLFSYLNGANVAVNRIRLRGNGDQGIAVAQAADGSMSQGGVVFDDSDSTMTVTGWMPFYANETACTSAPRLFTGYVGDRTYRRGHYRTGGGREIDTTINDQNILLQIHRIFGADSLRPAETDTARIAWLLGSGYIPLVSDLGLVNGAGRMFDATQYKGQFPSDVLNDLCGPRGQIFFVYWDQSAQALGLFYDAPDATSFTSTLTISNVLSDLSSTCFAPNDDDEGLFDPSEVYSNIRYVYKGGAVYVNNPTTAAAFFPSPLGNRDTLEENDRVGLRDTAITFATRILARDSQENVQLSMTVKLPAASVGLIQAGQRLGVRLSHVPGFSSLAYTRVQQITVAPTENTPDFYDVGLVLSTFGISGGGGAGGIGGTPPGSTGPFPIQPPGPAVHYWSGTFDFDSDGAGTSRGIGYGTTTSAASSPAYNNTFNTGETWTYGIGMIVNFGTGGTNADYAPSLALGTVAPGDHTIGHIVKSFMASGPTPPFVISLTGSFTVSPAEAGTWEMCASDAAGDHVPKNTVVTFWFDPPGWITGADPEPPPSGAPIPPEYLTLNPTPDGSTTLFTLEDSIGNAVPYSTLGVRVNMNGADLDPTRDYSETDPSAGTITFTHAPPVDAEITVWAQGI